MMRKLVGVALVALSSSACVHSNHQMASELPDYQDTKGNLDRVLETPDVAIYLPSTLECGYGAGMGTFAEVAIKNKLNQGLVIDPGDFYLENDGERRYNITHANSEITGAGWWVSQLLKNQEIEPGARIRGVLFFPECYKVESNFDLHMLNQTIPYKGRSSVSWGTTIAGTFVSLLLAGAIALPFLFF